MPRKKSEVQTGDVRRTKQGTPYVVVGMDGRQCFIHALATQKGTPMRLLKEIVKRWPLIERRVG